MSAGCAGARRAGRERALRNALNAIGCDFLHPPLAVHPPAVCPPLAQSVFAFAFVAALAVVSMSASMIASAAASECVKVAAPRRGQLDVALDDTIDFESARQAALANGRSRTIMS